MFQGANVLRINDFGGSKPRDQAVSESTREDLTESLDQRFGAGGVLQRPAPTCKWFVCVQADSSLQPNCKAEDGLQNISMVLDSEVLGL